VTDAELQNLTDVETQSSSSNPLEDVCQWSESEVLSQRWQCDLCYDTFMRHDTPWQLHDEGCDHKFCKRCVQGSIQWGGRCPYDNTPIPAIIRCGIMGTSEFIYHEKQDEALRVRGIMCVKEDCVGVVAPVEGLPARPATCPRCETRVCGRRICAAPWRPGHRCWDVVEEERRREEEEAGLRRWRDLGADSSMYKTQRRLRHGPRIRPCPGCGVMVERTDGCNMVYHSACRTRWCFACRSVGTCTDNHCRTPASGSSTPRSSRSTPVPGSPRSAQERAEACGRKFGFSKGFWFASFCMALPFVAVLFVCPDLRVGLKRSGFLNSGAGTILPVNTCETAGNCFAGLLSTSFRLIPPKPQVLEDSAVQAVEHEQQLVIPAEDVQHELPSPDVEHAEGGQHSAAIDEEDGSSEHSPLHSDVITEVVTDAVAEVDAVSSRVIITERIAEEV